MTLTLSDAIDDLRTQLLAAQKKGNEANPGLKFELVDVTVELSLVATNTVDGKATGGLPIFSVSAGITDAEARTHKICLKLKLAEQPGVNNQIGDVVASDPYAPKP